MVSAQELLNAEIPIVDDKAAHKQLLERLLREAGYANVDPNDGVAMSAPCTATSAMT